MLADHRIAQERWAHGMRERRTLAWSMAAYIARLAHWDWFVTLTLRDRDLQRGEPWERGEMRREGNLVICAPDPRLARYKPSTRFSPSVTPPFSVAVLKRVEFWLLGVQICVGQPIGWVIAEEFGRLGGRWHCHILVVGVSGLNHRFCSLEAYRRFGHTQIERFDPSRGAAFYAAKYAGRSLGEIHLGGTLAGVDLSKCEKSLSQGGGGDVAVSVSLPRSCFHMCLARWHR